MSADIYKLVVEAVKRDGYTYVSQSVMSPETMLSLSLKYGFGFNWPSNKEKNASEHACIIRDDQTQSEFFSSKVQELAAVKRDAERYRELRKYFVLEPNNDSQPGDWYCVASFGEPGDTFDQAVDRCIGAEK